MTLWLSRIIPNPRSPKARADVADAGALHRRLMGLMPDGLGASPRQQAGLLFRVDHTRRGTAVLVQSTYPVDRAALPTDYGQVDTRDLGPLLDHLAAGRSVRYRILASPTRRVGRSDKNNRRETTTPLRGPEANDWWRGRAQANGLVLQSLLAHDQADAVDRSRGRRIRHAAVLFQGVATIGDAGLVREAVHNGIGRGKAHGCGMLSLALMEGDDK